MAVFNKKIEFNNSLTLMMQLIVNCFRLYLRLKIFAFAHKRIQ